MKGTIKKVCVIIPAYNESAVVGDVIRDAIRVFSDIKRYDIDILLVNDGSRDDTAIQAKKAGARVIDHILNTGAGGATATGLNFAHKMKYVAAATMDADGQHKPADVIAGLDHLFQSQSDLSIGSRLIDSRGMPKVKVFGNQGLSFITRILFGINATDSQSGLRIYSSRSLERLRWTTSGYEFCSEMLWRAKQLNLKINEFPIKAVYTDYSKNKGQNNWNGVNIVKSLIKHRLAEILE